ncbi:glutathione S-transferase, partial [Aureobasidium melanogenum]
MSLKPIIIHGHAGGPNPWKVVLAMKELGLPYEHKLWDFPDLKKPDPEKYLLKQWLHFQVSGQGPYFGQRVWFNIYHETKIDSAVERYSKEIKRVLTVLDKHLKQQGTEYLVGDKYTYADLSFIPWQMLLPFIFGEQSDAFHAEIEKELPHYWAWWQRISNRPATQEMKKEREANFQK